MPTILRSGPYRFYFYSHKPNEAPPPREARPYRMATPPAKKRAKEAGRLEVKSKKPKGQTRA